MRALQIGPRPSLKRPSSDRSDRAFLPPRPPAPPPTRTGARPHYAEEAEEEEEEEEEGAAFAWEADLELVAGEVDFHANALKGAVLVRLASLSACAAAGLTRLWPAHQGRLLALKKKLTASAAALDSERRFISARAAALQHKADLLQARQRAAYSARRVRGSPHPAHAAPQETLFRERALSGSTRLRILSCVPRLCSAGPAWLACCRSETLAPAPPACSSASGPGRT